MSLVHFTKSEIIKEQNVLQRSADSKFDKESRSNEMNRRRFRAFEAPHFEIIVATKYKIPAQDKCARGNHCQDNAQPCISVLILQMS